MTFAIKPVLFEIDANGQGQQHPFSPTFKAKKNNYIWVHLFRDHPTTQDFLTQQELPHLIKEALMADETRPRCTMHEAGVVINLRGVNLNPGAEPEDMISARLWLTETMVISVWRRPLMAIQDIQDSITRNQAPPSAGSLVATLALRLADRAEPTVAKLNEQIDDLEEAVLAETGAAQRSDLADIRRMAIVLRRYMFPQRDALTTLQIEPLPWLTGEDRTHLREAAERVTRLAEELDALRDRAQVVQDQLVDQRAEQMNRQMLVLSVVAAIFLPLGLLTGLLGINVGGIPGTTSPYAFWLVTGLLILLGLIQLWLFKKARLLK